MIGSRTGRLLACFAVLSLTLAGCDIAGAVPTSSPAPLTLPATFSGSGVLTKSFIGVGYHGDCSATGTATVRIDVSGTLVLTVQVAAQPAMGLLGKCTTENGSATDGIMIYNVTDESGFLIEGGECSGGLAASGTGSFPGSGPDAGNEIIAHVTCGDPSGTGYTLDAVVMK